MSIYLTIHFTSLTPLCQESQTKIDRRTTSVFFNNLRATKKLKSFEIMLNSTKIYSFLSFYMRASQTNLSAWLRVWDPCFMPTFIMLSYHKFTKHCCHHFWNSTCIIPNGQKTMSTSKFSTNVDYFWLLHITSCTWLLFTCSS
jgi:hypothetical protein